MYKKFLSFSFVLVTLFTLPMQGSPELDSQETLKAVSKGFSTVAKKAIPAVVYIESQVTKGKSVTSEKKGSKGYDNPFDYFHDEFFNRFFGFPDESEKKTETVRGSGFIVSQDGYIMTNNHVVENAKKVTVTLHSGKKLIATVVGTDPKTDLAVIKLNEKNLPFLTFGNSDTLDVGDWTIAVGNPFGLEASVTVGVVSAKGRNQLHITDFEDFIQTDAAINPGNSGGPLLNIDAEVIGINTAIVSGSGGYMGIGFAIPSNMATSIMAQLIKEGSVTRGFLGVTLQPIDEDLAQFYKLENTHGALVTEVSKDSPAEKAGLKQEDLILSYNGNKIENLSAFRNAVSFMPPGSKIMMKVLREGKIKEIEVTITAVPNAEVAINTPVAKLGLHVQSLTEEIASKFGYEEEKGVIVTEVNPDSPAADAAIRPGSLIIAVNRKKVATLDEYNAAMGSASKEGHVLLMVRQGDVFRFVALKFE